MILLILQNLFLQKWIPKINEKKLGNLVSNHQIKRLI